VDSLARTYELLDLVRAQRPSQVLRDPMLPWFEVCRESGLPACGVEQHPDGAYVAATVLAKSGVRRKARERMRGVLDLPEIVLSDGDELHNDGWIAVIHADGNGIGQIFTNFPERALRASHELGDDTASLTLDRHRERLAAFTKELDLATETALGLAVRDTLQGRKDSDSTILPVVFGGDDVTVVCHARFALGIARRFLLNFGELASGNPTLRAIAGKPLTGAAGIAYVKPHHPFSAAYALAEELTASAKTATRMDVAAIDLHVAFESTLADLSTLRRRIAADGFPRHGGPYVVTAQESASAGPRDIDELDRTMGTLSKLSSSMAHDLREALARGRAEFEQQLQLAAWSPDLPTNVARDDIWRLAPVDGSGGDGFPADAPIVRLLDAQLLNSIAKGSPAAAAVSSEGQGVTFAGVTQ
ncbi:MAG: Cas10/Cmr2 second palm domain-containing protein, partial [Streptosporangiaceae bacterium]